MGNALGMNRTIVFNMEGGHVNYVTRLTIISLQIVVIVYNAQSKVKVF